MSQVTESLAKMREKEETEDLATKVTKLNEDLDSKISEAESKLTVLNDAFESFQNLTTENHTTSSSKLEEVEAAIKKFKSQSSETVGDVMSDTENLKVRVILTENCTAFNTLLSTIFYLLHSVEITEIYSHTFLAKISSKQRFY